MEPCTHGKHSSGPNTQKGKYVARSGRMLGARSGAIVGEKSKIKAPSYLWALEFIKG